jgi:hypothetical protein
VEFGYDKDYGSDLIKVSDFVGLSNFDSVNLRNGETDFVSFEKSFRQASVLPRSKLQKNGFIFESPFNAIISSNNAFGTTINAYGIEDRKIRLLVDPENIFYGSKMANFVASHPQSEVSKLLDDFKNGDVVHLNGTVIDNENDELLMIPNTLSKHPESLRSSEMTANHLLEQGDYLGAELLYRRALPVYEKVYGPENHETLGLVNNLAWVLILKSDNAEAEALCRRSLTGFEKIYGPEHPNTLQNINNLAVLLNQTDRRSAALKLLQERAALSDQTEDSVRYNLACYECLEGNIDAAKRLISDHLKVHPYKKPQALADSDLAAIREFIETLYFPLSDAPPINLDKPHIPMDINNTL